MSQTPVRQASADSAALPIAVRRHPLVSEAARRLHGECGVPGGATVVVAVSGGADSCALLLACAAIARRKRKGGGGAKIIAAHVHHHLRPEADAEMAFVQSLCASLGVELHVEHVHPAREPGSKGANARRLRYEALRRVAGACGAAFIATAHHADDQLETMVMALARGAGLRGVRGMKWRRPLRDDVLLVRPLLLARKRDCEDLCTLAGVEWCEDASNIDPRSKRARIRRNVLPVLEDLWPGAARRSVGTADMLAAAEELVRDRIEQTFGPAAAREWPRAALKALSTPLIGEGLRRAAEQANGGPITALSQRHLRNAATFIRSAERRPKRFEWPGGLVVHVTSKAVSLTRR